MTTSSFSPAAPNRICPMPSTGLKGGWPDCLPTRPWLRPMSTIPLSSAGGAAARMTLWPPSATGLTPCLTGCAQTESLPIGRYRGLAFGLILHPGGAAEMFLEGAATRRGLLSRDHRGPRAVLNALDRLAEGYQGECNATRRELAVAQDQLRDHTGRLGRPFPHNAYMAELTDLRDQLKAGLSGATPESGAARCRPPPSWPIASSP